MRSAPCVLAVLLLIFASTAAAQTQGSVCISCHEGEGGSLAEPVALWRSSHHAENGVSCDGCHGGNPREAGMAMSPAQGFVGRPGEEEIPAFCGRCHLGVRDDYLASAHGAALGSGGPTCVTCHGSHGVARASLALIDEKSCSRCHGFDRARVIRDAMRQSDDRIGALDARIGVFRGEGVDTDRLEKGLFAVRNRFHALFHEVDVERVRRESARIDAELDRLAAVLRGWDESRRRRRLAGAAAVAAALLAALLLRLLRKTYDDGRRPGAGGDPAP